MIKIPIINDFLTPKKAFSTKFNYSQVVCKMYVIVDFLTNCMVLLLCFYSSNLQTMDLLLLNLLKKVNIMFFPTKTLRQSFIVYFLYKFTIIQEYMF